VRLSEAGNSERRIERHRFQGAVMSGEGNKEVGPVKRRLMKLPTDTK